MRLVLSEKFEEKRCSIRFVNNCVERIIGSFQNFDESLASWRNIIFAFGWIDRRNSA